jgi:hypothetical protein
MLQRKANIRGHRMRAVGTLVVTATRLSFRPLAREKHIDIPLANIQDILVVGWLFKKIRIATQQHIYTVYVKGAKHVATLLQTLQSHLATQHSPSDPTC